MLIVEQHERNVKLCKMVKRKLKAAKRKRDERWSVNIVANYREKVNYSGRR